MRSTRRRAALTLPTWVAALLAALIALTVSALGAGTAHAAAWFAGPPLTTTATAGSSQTAIGADGGAAVIAAEYDPFGGAPIPIVVVRRTGPDGAQLGQLPVGHGLAVDVVALPGGGYRAVWIAPGPPTNRLMTATVDATGRVSSMRPLADMENFIIASDGGPIGAVAADGSVVVAWKVDPAAPADPPRLRVLHVGADGAKAPIADLGPISENTISLQLERASDGSAWLLWDRPLPGPPNAEEQMVGRVSAAGVGASAVLDDDALPGMARLAVGGGDTVVAWATDAGDVSDVLVRRLPSSGPLAGAATTVATALPPIFALADVAVATDGTATVVWSRFDEQTTSTAPVSRQLAPSGTLGPVREISPPTGFVEQDVFPLVEAGRDGTFVVQWLRGFPNGASLLKGVSRVLDSSGAAVGPELAVPYTVIFAQAAYRRLFDLTVSSSGTGLLTVAAPNANGGGWPIFAVRFDGTPPALDANAPTTAVRGTAASFAARASDPSGIAKVTWEFGDGTSTEGADVTHVYHAAGVRTVTATATDAAGETTSVTREISVGEPPPGPAPAPAPAPGPGPGGTPRGPAPTAKLASAKLRVTKATRRGARITVRGTIDRRARGRVTVTWRQKSGRKTVKRTARAKIARGRFTATIKLPRALARSRATGRLTVTYTGDRTLRRTTVTRTVRAPGRRAARRRG